MGVSHSNAKQGTMAGHDEAKEESYFHSSQVP